MIDLALRFWPVFSVRMIAGVTAKPEYAVQRHLDHLVSSGVLRRWRQSYRGHFLPDAYYLAP